MAWELDRRHDGAGVAFEEHDADDRGVDDEPAEEQQPGQEREHDAERAPERAGRRHHSGDDERTDDLERDETHSTDHRAGDVRAPPDVDVRERARAPEKQHEPECHADRDRDDTGEGREPVQRRDDCRARQEERAGPEEPEQTGKAILEPAVVNLPGPIERKAERAGDAEACPQEAGEPENRGGLTRVRRSFDCVLELIGCIAGQPQVFDDARGKRGVARLQEADDRDPNEDQGKESEEKLQCQRGGKLIAAQFLKPLLHLQ